jgi:pyruvate dehydrogenase E2 component (dihydrolipoamide acetyltransferase)
VTSAGIERLAMPKWGLSMTEGRIVSWLVEEGATLSRGQTVAEVETEKINGTVEAPADGALRRRVAQEGEVVPVGGLLGVVADASVPDEDVDAFVADFQATFVPGAEEAEAGPRTETVEVGGRRLRFVREGDGEEAVVLLHGFGGDLNNWLFNMEPLAAERTVYALDLPGHGESAKDVGSGELEELVGALAGFLDARGVEHAHLVGHSLGGAVAAAFALEHPDRALSLTLVASAGLGPEINREYIEGFIAARSRRELKPVIELLFADPGLVTRQLLDDVLRYKRLDGVHEALSTLAERLFPDGRQAVDLGPRLRESSVPILAIWGADDRIVPARHAEALPESARVEVLEGRGHSPHMEAASEVNRIATAFIAGPRVA